MMGRPALGRLVAGARRRTVAYRSIRRTTHGPLGRRLWVAVARQTPAFGWSPDPDRAANPADPTGPAEPASPTGEPDLPAQEAEQMSGLRARVRDHLLDVEVRLRELERRRPDRIRLRDARLGGADLSGAQLAGVDLTGAQLRGADLSRAQLRDANLEHSDLSGANLTDAALLGASLTDATLNGANIAGATWDETTRWPAPHRQSIESSSRELRPGVFQVRYDAIRSPLSP